MNIALVNLITKTADLPKGRTAKNPVPDSDDDLNITKLAKTLASKGHNVTIYISDAYEPTTKCSSDGINIIYVPTRLTSIFPPAVFPCTPSLKTYLKQNGFDIVQSGEVFQMGTIYSNSAVKNSHSKLFVWQELDVLMQGMAGTIQKQFYNTLGKRIAKNCKIIPRSKSAATHLIDYGFDSDLITQVVHSGVDCSVFRPMDKDESRREFGLPADQNVAISVGRLHYNKGMDILVRAAKIIREEDPNFKLILKGTGPEEENLRALIQKLGLADTVFIHTDYLDSHGLAELYNCADLYMLSSRNDLFPFTAIESISCGIPILSSFSRGIESDIVGEGAGIMAPQTPENIADSAIMLFNDPGRLKSMSCKARDLAVGEFDFGVSADRLCCIYEESQ
ncbi:glycosyltransferase family 4 protein [Candidatus Methanomassiliicoccus intestinalis]|uniref:glycosyltransferase family 4 protein n=1 Tax=Candidatus Methanomassiliicoccus intestinalis TaxID=1406512 RepID=UPI0037DD1AE0